jgi:hypothetical protein
VRGHIVQRSKGKGTWSIVIELDKDASGKRKQQWVTVVGSRRDAERRLREILTQRDMGNYVKPGKTTLGEYLDKWLVDSVNNLSPRTAEGYEYIVRHHLVPSLGQIPLTQLKPDHLQHLFSSKLSSGRHDGKGRIIGSDCALYPRDASQGAR